MKKTKKILCLILSLALLFSLSACGGSDDVAKAEHGDKDYLGTYTENTYRNERFGVLFTAPGTEFQFAMLDDIVKANDMKEDDFSNSRVPEILADGKEYMVMYGGDNSTANSTAVVLSKVEEGTDQEKFVEEALEKTKASLALDSNVEVLACELKTGSPVGYDKYIVYTIKANDQTFYAEQFFCFTDINMASISISATSQGMITLMHTAWKRISN